MRARSIIRSSILMTFVALPLMAAVPVPFSLVSPAFTDGGPIPVRFTCDGVNLSPPLAWAAIPPGTQSLALVVDDPDAPAGDYLHWALYNLSPAIAGIAEAYPSDGPGQGQNSFGKVGYGGPCPPLGSAAHNYRFRLVALNSARIDPPAATQPHQIMKYLQPYLLDTATLIGLYRRQP
jgi:Raf kinase inhibitor-like YbhB/YbcL family protein